MVNNHIKQSKVESKEVKRKKKVQSTEIEKVVDSVIKENKTLKKVKDSKQRQSLLSHSLQDITNHKDAKQYIDKNGIKSMQELVEYLDKKLMSSTFKEV